MKYIRIIFALTALITASSCVVENLEPISNNKNIDEVTIIGQVARFQDWNVTTKASKNEAESKINSMAIAIFPVLSDNKGLAGGCVHYEYVSEQTQLMFTLDRGDKYDNDARYAIYIFANMPGLGEFKIDENTKVGPTLEYILENTLLSNINNLNIPENGFPMIGSIGDTFSERIDQDGYTLIISPIKDGKLATPKVTHTDKDGNEITEELSVLTVPMKALYAKVNFTIQVSPTQVIPENDPPQFTLESYTINNVPASVDFDKQTNAGENNSTIDVMPPIVVNRVANAMGNNIIEFSFYMPENLVKETEYDPSNYAYPFRGSYEEAVDKDKDGIRDEDEIKRQRYKSKLLFDKQKATNIVISGQYRDHQMHYFDVDYTIHLGKDAHGDFNVCRNVEYKNYVTITGIKNSNEENQGEVSIDHRVTITPSQPAIISLNREVLLDSHFEIRPLRIRKSNVEADNINAIEVTVENPGETDWMRLERSFGKGSLDECENSGLYITTDPKSPSYGKRKYFTYGLVSGTQFGGSPEANNLVNNTTVIVPIPTNKETSECVWIYVDECTEIGDGVRSGVIKLSYGTHSGTSFTPANDPKFPDVYYTINQRKLFNVVYENQTDNDTSDDVDYYIEYEEEYLYNFDGDDNFGENNNQTTEYEGMKWGLNNVEISSQYPSIFITDGNLAWLIDWFIDENAGKYDFYLDRDKPRGNSTVRAQRSGQTFCREIIASNNVDIDILDLATKPESAVEYCYNKNKRDSDGEVVDDSWYLPSIDEVEEIMQSKYKNESREFYTYSRFLDFQDKYYWSSMPAYERSTIDYSIYFSAGGTFYRDDIDRARATKVNYLGKIPNEDGVEVDNFEIPTSGVVPNKYTNTLYIREMVSIIPPVIKVSFEPTTQRDRTGLYFEGEDPSYYEPGNKSRNDMARVRCIRKKPAIN